MKEIEIEKIIERGLIGAVQKRDILKIKIVNRQIIAKSPLGYEFNLSKRDLIERYTFLNNKKIKLGGLSKRKEYVVYREDNKKAKVIKLPVGNVVKLKDRYSPGKGEYLIFYFDDKGKLIKDVGVLGSILFRKMFILEDNEIIDIFKNKHTNKQINNINNKSLNKKYNKNEKINARYKAVARVMQEDKIAGFIITDGIRKRK